MAEHIDYNIKKTDVQKPLPVNSDSVYASDIDVANSDIYNFSGVVTDLFDSLLSVIIDDTDTKYTNTNATSSVTALTKTILWKDADLTANISDGDYIKLKNTTDNDGIYTVDTISYSAPDTTIVVNEDLIDETFSDLDEVIVYTKKLKIWFYRTVSLNSIGFGCDDPGESFSNLIIKGLGSGSEVRYTKNLSDDDTERRSYLVSLPPLKANGIQLEFLTDNEICLSNIIIAKAQDSNARILAASELTEEVEGVASFRNALKVDTALVHKEGVNLFFFRETGVGSTIAVAASDGDTSITVADATGFTVGNRLRLTSTIATGQPFLIITNIAANLITLDRPLVVDLDIGDTADIVDTQLNANGSLASPVIYKIKPPNGVLSLVWQLTRLLINITDGTAMDDGKFGGISALTNGVVLRVVKGDGTIQELTNWKTNGDMALDMYDVTYTDKGPAGDNGLRARWTFTKAEFIVELNGAAGDEFELLVQDALSGLSTYEMKSQGRLFGA